tara:strand:- start:1352 stop:1981 length:630 start_codon:yes stop_codon:yes gene_type:complete
LNLKDFKNQTLKYARFQGQDLEDFCVTFLNQEILSFLRKKEWDKTIYNHTLTLDGSGSYDLEALLPNYFHAIHDLIKPGSNRNNKQFMRIDYDNYINQSNKASLWSIVGRTLYIEGDANSPQGGTVDIFYRSPGSPYPVSDPTDEPQIMIDYIEILEKMVVFKMLIQIGDMEQAAIESQLLEGLLKDARTDENKARKRGKVSTYSSYWR